MSRYLICVNKLCFDLESEVQKYKVITEKPQRKKHYITMYITLGCNYKSFILSKEKFGMHAFCGLRLRVKPDHLDCSCISISSHGVTHLFVFTGDCYNVTTCLPITLLVSQMTCYTFYLLVYCRRVILYTKTINDK